MIYILSVVLIVSLIGNFLLLWYVRELLIKMWTLTESKKDIWDTIENYSDHLKAIYEMEMYYGDETMQGLIQHTKYLKDYFEDYRKAELLFEEEDFAKEKEEEIE